MNILAWNKIMSIEGLYYRGQLSLSSLKKGASTESTFYWLNLKKI